MPFFNWSKTAAPNGNSDPTQSWVEGQAPSSLNDSARALLAALAQQRDDQNGSLLTTGTSTAYSLSTNSNFTTAAFLSGQMIAFTPHATNGPGPVTMTIDSQANIPLRSAPSVELPAGVLIQGTPYFARFNMADGALYLNTFFGNPFGIPISGGMIYFGPAAPNSSFAFVFGQAISRTAFAALFAIIGTTYGVGDGSTTFNLPDLRGRIPIGFDVMGGTPSGRLTTALGGVDGTTIGASGGSQAATILQSNLPNVAPTFTGTPGTASSTQPFALVAVNESEGSGSNAPAEETPATATVVSNFTPAGTISSINGNVTQTGTKTLPPVLVVPYVMRII